MPARPPRRGSLRARAELSLAAFSPAFALMVWRAWGEPLAWVFGIAALLGLLTVALVIWAIRTGNPEPFTFGDISDSSADVLGHIGSYLAVAVIDPKASASEAALSLAVFGLIFLIHVSVGLVHVNPLAYMFGYRVYTGTTTQDTAYYLVVKSEVADWNGPQHLIRVDPGLLVERSRRAD